MDEDRIQTKFPLVTSLSLAKLSVFQEPWWKNMKKSLRRKLRNKNILRKSKMQLLYSPKDKLIKESNIYKIKWEQRGQVHICKD